LRQTPAQIVVFGAQLQMSQFLFDAIEREMVGNELRDALCF
jgi:hypothetical protein